MFLEAICMNYYHPSSEPKIWGSDSHPLHPKFIPGKINWAIMTGDIMFIANTVLWLSLTMAQSSNTI